MDKKEKKDMIQLFNEGFKEVVLPHIDDIYDELKDIKKIQNEHSRILEDHGDSLERIESRQEAETKRLDKYDIKNENHEERIIRLKKEAMFK